MDFRVAVRKGNATGQIVVASRSVLKFICHHRDCKPSIINAAVILIQEHKKPGWGWPDDLCSFPICEPGTVATVAMTTVQPGTVYGQCAPARRVGISPDGLAHRKSSRRWNSISAVRGCG